MNRSYLLVSLFALSLAACGQKAAETPVAPAPVAQAPAAAAAATPSGAMPAGHPPMDLGKMTQAAPAVSLTQKAQVLSTIDVPQYTYIEVLQDNKNRWLAATTVALKKGDTVQFNDGTTMVNFNSKTLNRTFPNITFVDRVVVANGNP